MEETQELLDRYSRHGAGIPRTADDPNADASITWFLSKSIRNSISWDRESDPNHINGLTPKEYMALLRRKYGD